MITSGRRRAVAALFLFIAMGLGAQSSEQEPVTFGFDLLPFVGTSSAMPQARRIVSLNLVGGLSGGVEQAELGGVFNITTGEVSGVQLAGTGNVVTGAVDGLQGSGTANVVTGPVSGLQGAGTANVVVGDIQGLQAAGSANVVVGGMQGLQGAGAVNVVTRDVQGLQLGVLNVTAGEVEGGQIGILNYALASTGSIGLISVVPKGFLDVEFFTSEEGLALSGIRHGDGKIYNVYYAGSRFAPNGTDFAYGLGLGWQTPLAQSWSLNIDVTTTHVVFGGNFDKGSALIKLRPMASWRTGPRFALFGGPTLTLHATEADTNELDYLEMWSLDSGNDVDAGMWLGATVGVRVF